MALRMRLLLAGLGALILLTGCELPPETVAVGARVPAYTATDLEGNPVTLQDLRGEVVVLNVWATWCAPCRREMPALHALDRELGPYGLRVVAVSIDRAGATGEIDLFLREHDLEMTILHDPDQKVARTFRLRGVPETFLIARDGTVLRHWIGLIDPHAESIRAPVRAALAEG